MSASCNRANIEIVASAGSYQVQISPGYYARLLQSPPDDTVIICDARFATALTAAGCQVIALAADERTKSLENIPHLMVWLRELGARRSTHILAIGGGVIQDAASFSAAIYMGGLRWSYVPTTLLGMADSCIGGESAINAGPYKSLAGGFHPPSQVIIDTEFLRTLPPIEIAAGLCEAAKICFCRDGEVFAAYRALTPSVTMMQSSADEIISLSLHAKKWFIEKDEFGRTEQQLLDFGHCFGHAIEAASHYAMPHGIAAGFGMLCAIRLSHSLNANLPLSGDTRFLEEHIGTLIAYAPDLPKQLAAIPIPVFLDRFQADKKHTASDFRVVLIDGTGRAVMQNLPRNAASLERVSDAFLTTRSSFRQAAA